MIREMHYCAHHPKVAATDTCSQCGKWICYNCRTQIFGKIFCSAQCVTIFVIKEMVIGIFRVAKGVVKKICWFFYRMGRLPRRSLMELILGFGLIFCFYFIWKLTQEVRLLEDKTEGKEVPVETVDTTFIPPPKIFQPTEGGMVFSSKLDIVGEVDENRIVSLSIDGKLARVILPQDGKFEFDEIKLKRGQNRLEVRALTEEGKVSLLQTLVFTYASPTLAYLARDFRRGNLARKEVALTFDGGSINNATDEILDILREKGIKTTFFVTGEFIRKYPRTVKRIVAEGHEVGNHTWSHPHLTSFAKNRRHNTLPDITADKIKEEFSKTESLFKLVSGHEMVSFWRAPYGEYNKEILHWAAEAGYKHVGWTVGRGWEETMDTLDWVADKNSKSYRSADEIVKKILNYAKGKKHGANGAIILMHLGTHRKEDFPHKKLPEIIDGLRKEGYHLLKISEMISEG